VVEPQGSTAEFRSSFAWRSAAAATGLVATLLTTVVAVRGLAHVDAAVFLAILAGLMLGPMFGKLGLGQNVIRTAGSLAGLERRRSISAHLQVALLLSVATSPLVAFVSTLGLVGRPDRAVVVLLTSVILVAESMRMLLSDVFAAVGDVRASVASTHHVRTLVVLPALIAVVLLVERPTLTEVLSVYTVVAIVLLVLATVRARRLLVQPRRQAWAGLSTTILAGLVLVVLDASFFVVGRGDVWLASALFTPFDATRYGTVSMLAFQVTVLQGLVSLAITPVAARMWAAGRRAEVVRLLTAAATVTTAATVAIVLALAAAGSTFLSLAYGKDFASSLPMLLVLAAGSIGQAALGFSVPYLLITGMVRRAVVACVIALAIALPVAAVGALWFGPIGLAAGSAFASLLLPAAQTVVAHGGPLPSWDVRRALGTLRHRDPSTVDGAA